ncbi:MAG TPA: tail fiber domain-containing protein [Ohtaekwangia sp.]
MTTLSDGRFKRDIKYDVRGLEFINQLKPVSYVIDDDKFDKFIGIPDSMKIRTESISKPRQTGFIAQDVEKIIKDSGYTFSGVDLPKNDKDPYGIRYADFVVPLVKAVQELNAKVDEQQKKIDVLLSQIDNQGLKSNDANSESSTIGLRQNNPNPFSVDTEIHMVLPEAARTANIIIYNLEGSQLKSIPVNSRGNAAVKVSASELKPGMYIYALIVDGKVIDTKRMILTQ